MHLENLSARPGRIAEGAHDDQDVTARFEHTLLTSFDLDEIKRAFRETTVTLLEIMTLVDADLSHCLSEPLKALVRHCDF